METIIDEGTINAEEINNFNRIQNMLNEAVDNKNINYDIIKGKKTTLFKIFEDIKYVNKFVFRILIEYTKQRKLNIPLNIISWQTEYIVLNMLFPYIENNYPTHKRRRELRKLLDDSHIDGEYELTEEYENIVNYLNSLIENISA